MGPDWRGPRGRLARPPVLPEAEGKGGDKPFCKRVYATTRTMEGHLLAGSGGWAPSINPTLPLGGGSLARDRGSSKVWLARLFPSACVHKQMSWGILTGASLLVTGLSARSLITFNNQSLTERYDGAVAQRFVAPMHLRFLCRSAFPRTTIKQ